MPFAFSVPIFKKSSDLGTQAEERLKIQDPQFCFIATLPPHWRGYAVQGGPYYSYIL